MLGEKQNSRRSKRPKWKTLSFPSLWFRWEATWLHVQQQKLLFRCVSYFLNDISFNHLEEWEYWQTGLNPEIPEIWLQFYFFFFFLETPPDIQIKRNTSANQREIMRYENDWRAATEWRARGLRKVFDPPSPFFPSLSHFNYLPLLSPHLMGVLGIIK